jgi:hypothetical protein
MRMLIDERSMRDVMTELYVAGLAADKVTFASPIPLPPEHGKC